jgi:hypothetical protein
MHRPGETRRASVPEEKRSRIVLRLIASLICIIIYGWINFLLNPISTIATGKLAGMQLENSDTAYVVSQFGMDFFHNLGIPAIVLLAVLILIWWKELASLTKLGKTGLLVLFIMLAGASHAFAFYDKVDRAEAIYVLPDESFFWVPDVGDNKSSQVKLNSEEYYAANKLAVKRFVIPHVQFTGSNPMWFDYYVPSGRAIIQPRTPYNREWTKDSKRGTSPRDESFPCQDSQGINVTVEIGIGAFVTEEQAPRYLSHFGVKSPAGNREDPQVIFASVYYGKDLPQVMDGVIRSKIQTLVCGEISTRPLDKVNSEAYAIMKKIAEDAGNYCASKGITLDYIGWAGTFTFDKDIQQAINDRYSAQAIAPYLSTLQAKAVIDAFNKWDGHAPGSVSLWWLPSDIGDFFSRFLNTEQKAGGEPAKAGASKKQ